MKPSRRYVRYGRLYAWGFYNSSISKSSLVLSIGFTTFGLARRNSVYAAELYRSNRTLVLLKQFQASEVRVSDPWAPAVLVSLSV